VGLAIQVLFVPVLVVVILLLVISIIGIPLLLLIPFAMLALLVAWVVGYSGAAMAVGRWAKNRFGWSLQSPFAMLLVGIALLQSVSFVGEAFDVLPGFVWIFSLMFGLVGFVIEFAAWTIGLGAVFLGGFRRGSDGVAAGAPAPPLPPQPSPPPARTGEQPAVPATSPEPAAAEPPATETPPAE
jgi:hypothetical protein